MSATELDRFVQVATHLLRQGHVVTVKDIVAVLMADGVPLEDARRVALEVWQRAMRDAGTLPGLAKCKHLGHAAAVAAQHMQCAAGLMVEIRVTGRRRS
jgi:hypothetical protein